MMDSESYYRSLTEKELRLLVAHDDDKATEEFIRRSKSGEIKRKHYTAEQLEEAVKKIESKRKKSA